MLTLDTSGVIALLDRNQPDHGEVVRALDADPGPYLVPAGILAEVAYMVHARVGHDAVDLFLADIEQGNYVVHCEDMDLTRVRELMARYNNLPLGFADASVVACAEQQSDPTVLTVDRRDFDVVAAEGTIRVVP